MVSVRVLGEGFVLWLGLSLRITVMRDKIRVTFEFRVRVTVDMDSIR